MVNSRLGLFTATPLLKGVLLLPKLRSYFAEFLRESFLAPLSILYLSTCVGLRYRLFLCIGNTNFSRKYDLEYSHLLKIGTKYHNSALFTFFFVGSLVYFHRNPIICYFSLLRPSLLQKNKYRNINLFPIDYIFRSDLRT